MIITIDDIPTEHSDDVVVKITLRGTEVCIVPTLILTEHGAVTHALTITNATGTEILIKSPKENTNE